MRLAILNLSPSGAPFLDGGPSFGETLADWTQRAVPEAALTLLDIAAGATLPEPAGFDGYVISGSDKGVYDETPWMARLRAFLQAAREAGKPLLGICFGHQIMADAFGGKAEKVGDPVVGVRWFDIEGARLPAHVWHQDQVTKVPSGARVIARADYCPTAGLAYDFAALSVQFHPEYSARFMGGFIDRSRGHVLSEALSDQVLAEQAETPVAEDLFTTETGAFFRGAFEASGAAQKARSGQ